MNFDERLVRSSCEQIVSFLVGRSGGRYHREGVREDGQVSCALLQSRRVVDWQFCRTGSIWNRWGGVFFGAIWVDGGQLLRSHRSCPRREPKVMLSGEFRARMEIVVVLLCWSAREIGVWGFGGAGLRGFWP